MNDNDKTMEIFEGILKTVVQHQVKLDFKCVECGQVVYQTLVPAQPPIPWPTFGVGCRCLAVGWTEDPEMTSERWADLVRGVKNRNSTI